MVLADRDEGLLDAFADESLKYFRAVAENAEMNGWRADYADGLEAIDHSSVVFAADSHARLLP